MVKVNAQNKVVKELFTKESAPNVVRYIRKDGMIKKKPTSNNIDAQRGELNSPSRCPPCLSVLWTFNQRGLYYYSYFRFVELS